MFKATFLWWGIKIKDFVYQQICNLIGKEKLDNQKFLLLTSGGVDSLVLLDLFIQLKKSHNISLIIFHVNYMLHENSNLMEQVCLSNAKSNNLKILISKCDKNLFKNKNIESKARNYRYEKVVEFSKDLNVNYVLTAHHEDDQI